MQHLLFPARTETVAGEAEKTPIIFPGIPSHKRFQLSQRDPAVQRSFSLDAIFPNRVVEEGTAKKTASPTLHNVASTVANAKRNIA